MLPPRRRRLSKPQESPNMSRSPGTSSFLSTLRRMTSPSRVPQIDPFPVIQITPSSQVSSPRDEIPSPSAESLSSRAPSLHLDNQREDGLDTEIIAKIIGEKLSPASLITKRVARTNPVKARQRLLAGRPIRYTKEEIQAQYDMTGEALLPTDTCHVQKEKMQAMIEARQRRAELQRRSKENRMGWTGDVSRVLRSILPDSRRNVAQGDPSLTPVIPTAPRYRSTLSACTVQPLTSEALMDHTMYHKESSRHHRRISRDQQLAHVIGTYQRDTLEYLSKRDQEPVRSFTVKGRKAFVPRLPPVRTVVFSDEVYEFPLPPGVSQDRYEFLPLPSPSAFEPPPLATCRLTSTPEPKGKQRVVMRQPYLQETTSAPERDVGENALGDMGDCFDNTLAEFSEEEALIHFLWGPAAAMRFRQQRKFEF